MIRRYSNRLDYHHIRVSMCAPSFAFSTTNAVIFTDRYVSGVEYIYYLNMANLLSFMCSLSTIPDGSMLGRRQCLLGIQLNEVVVC
jgi:hypothetical protein